jgi:hypothetical protein
LERGHQLIAEAEQAGLHHVPDSPVLRLIEPFVVVAHVEAFQVTLGRDRPARRGRLAIPGPQVRPRPPGPDLQPPLAPHLRLAGPLAGDRPPPAAGRASRPERIARERLCS